MALSTELLQRLDADEEPLPKRLKLARNAFCSTDLSISRKEDLIVQWLCNIAPTDADAWQTLKVCLDSGNLNDRLKLKPEVKQILIQTLLDKLQNDPANVSDEMWECCRWVLSNAGIQHYFKNRLEEFGSLLKHVLNSILIHIRHSKQCRDEKFLALSVLDIDKATLTTHSCAMNAIESIVQTHKQSLDKDRFTVVFLEHVLHPLCGLINTKHTDCTNRLGAETHKCIQQILFGKHRQAEYIEYNDGEKKGVPDKLFSMLAKFTEDTNVEHTQVTFDYVFRAAAGSYKANTALIDGLFRNLINCAGKYKTQILNSLLQFLKDITFEFENKISDVTLTTFFQTIIDEILAKKHLSGTDYKVFHGIANLNPLIVENKLPVILKRILLEERSTEDEEDSYVALMIGILEAIKRLRREQKIIPWILMALKESLTENKTCSVKAKQIFPDRFALKFMNLVGDMTSSQIVAMLRSLTFHLKTDCVSAIKGNSSNETSLMAEATVDLLGIFFNGVRICEHTVPLASQQKFSNALSDLGDVLSTLAEKTLNMTHDKKLIGLLLAAVLSWSEMQSELAYYLPKSESDKLTSPISADQWQQLVQRVTNFGEEGCKNAMNKLLLHRIRVSVVSEPPVKLTGLIGGMEHSWPLILKYNPQILPLLNLEQLSELASLVLADITASTDGYYEWSRLLREEDLQENIGFITAMLCQSFVQIGSVMNLSVTKTLVAHIDVIKIIEAEVNKHRIPVLKDMTIRNDETEWSCVSEEDSRKIEPYLESLLCLPLMYLSPGLRSMTFLVTYAISRECEMNIALMKLCNSVLSDSLEDGVVDIFEFIDPTLLVSCLPGNEVLARGFELSLRNVTSYKSLKRLIKSEVCPTEAAPHLLACIEKVMPKLNGEQKTFFKKVEMKLSKLILGTLDENLRKPHEVKSLILAFKSAIGNERVTDRLKKLIKSTLDFIFVSSDSASEMKDNEPNTRMELISDGLELAVIALRHRSTLEIQDETIEHIWPIILEYPDTELLTPFLEASGSKVFHNLMILLHQKTVEKMHDPSDGVSLINILGIWECIVKTDMGALRNKTRTHALAKIVLLCLQIEIPAQYWPMLLKLFQISVSSTHLPLTGAVIDEIILVAGRSLRTAKMLVCNDILLLCLTLLRVRVAVIIDKLPALLLLYRQVLTLVASLTKKGKETVGDRQLGLVALNIEKVTNAFGKLKRDMVRVSPYVIADLVQLFSEGALPPNVKGPLENCVVVLLSICDPHAVALLFRALPPANREIFKSLHDTYNKFYRFTGKI